MTNRKTFSRFGLVTVAALLVLGISVSNALLQGFRLDLTQNKLYTLSEGTEKILENIEEPVNLYFFYSDRATANIPQLRTYAGRIRETLQEFVQHSNGKLRLTIIDPLPFSEDEDRANEFGLQGVALQSTSDPIYMGIAGTNSIGDEEIIAFLDPGKENFLEYDLAKLVYTLSNPERPVIGLITDLPMFSGFDNQTQQSRQPWLIVPEVQQLFAVRTLSTTETQIDADIDVLMVVHPKELGSATLYAIDQFVLGGGRALFAVDPFSEVDIPPPNPQNPQAALMASRSSSLNNLTDAWGVSVNTENVVGDDLFALEVSAAGLRPTRHIGLIGIDDTAMDEDDVIMSGVRILNFGYTGYIEVADDASATVTPLVQSSDIAAPLPVNILPFMQDPATLRDGFSPTGERYTLAARIQGKVSSAFPEGPPVDVPTGPDAEHLTEAVDSINVILIADTDIFTDRLWAQVQNVFGQRLTTAFANNGNFIVNALDNLTGSGDLISIRGRGTFNRPFTRVQNLRREAEGQYRITEQRLQQELQATEAKLAELQVSRDDSNALILTSEQEDALERFQQERINIRKELRKVRRNLDQSIESLGTWLKIINIGLMPLIITVISLALVFLGYRRKSKAR
jgi:ABC-type uncharacterized transport system involved in gliding motility auxiliary subunit